MKKHDVDYLMANIAVVEERLKKGKQIDDVRAYLAKAFIVNIIPGEPKEEKLPLAQKAGEDRKELELAVLKANYTQERKAELEKLMNGFSKKELIELKEEFEEKILATNFHADIYKSK